MMRNGGNEETSLYWSCDSIDAMTSNRSYRKAHDFDYCYQEIKNNLGKMYDPIIGQYVLDHWEEIISVIKISR